MEVIAFCGAFSSSTLMHTAIMKIPSDKKVLIIEGRGMLLARNVDAPPQCSGGLVAYLEHCYSRPEKEPSVEPYLEKIVRSVYVLNAVDAVDFCWDRFYLERHGYEYLEHLRDQFQNLGFDYVLIDVGPPLISEDKLETKDAFFLAATYQFPNKVVWTDNSEEFAIFQFVLSISEKESFPTRVKSVITDADNVL